MCAHHKGVGPCITQIAAVGPTPGSDRTEQRIESIESITETTDRSNRAGAFRSSPKLDPGSSQSVHSAPFIEPQPMAATKRLEADTVKNP